MMAKTLFALAGFLRYAAVSLVLSALFIATLSGAAEAQGRKLALVVGNEAYEHLPGLATPAADAQDMAKALRDLGFEVTLLTDVGPEVFQAVLTTFSKQAESAETVLFYYSGHAFQKDGVNHLVPISARLETADAVEAETWRLDDIAAKLKSGSGQLLLFLDACRDNSVPAAVQAGLGGKGLAQFDGGAGTFVAFATAPGSVAWDKQDGTENSPFTHALLTHLAQPGQSISDLMIDVRNDVEAATGGKQTPWDQSSLRAQFYFAARDATVSAAVSAAELGLVVVTGSSTLVSGPDGPEVAVIDGVNTTKVIEKVTGVGQTRLAALDTSTRSLATIDGGTSGAVRITGVDAAPGAASGPVLAPLPDNLPLAVQVELDRIGCYGLGIDGQWGNGSRQAMRGYYKAKAADVGEVEPSEAVYRALKAEPEGVCSVAAKAPQKAAKKPAVKAKPAVKKAAAPAAKKPVAKAPAKKPAVVIKPGGGGGCKFVIVAIICS